MSLLAQDVELVIVSTSGDQEPDRPIWQIGGKGAFVGEVQAAVLDGQADFAVHSAKDLPALTPQGLRIAAVPERADARDALVGSRLVDLPAGAVVATGSVRRRAQLAWHRPDLTYAELRGNVDTRLRKAEVHDAAVVAAAALDRLGRSDRIAERLDPAVVLPQVAQGALAVECRAEDEELIERLRTVEHPPSRRAVDAERAFLEALEGDCDLPAGAHAVVDGDHVTLTGVLASLDGHVLIRDEERGEPLSAGRVVGERLKAKMSA